jgi:Leucine-rich repeat (LRR) protein
MNKLKRLHTLEAADNALTGLPPNFSELKDLRTLDLCGNKIIFDYRLLSGLPCILISSILVESLEFYYEKHLTL